MHLLANLTLLAVLLALLVSPYVLSFRLISYSSPEGREGAILSASTEEFGGYLKFGQARELRGRRQTIIAHAFSGQTVYYRKIFTVKNDGEWATSNELRVENIEGQRSDGVRVELYFGNDPTAGKMELSPGQEIPVDLKITSPPFPEKDPFPLIIQFSLESF